jgi:hypothetical protein
LPERFSFGFHVSHYSNAEYRTKQHLFFSETRLSAFGPRVASRTRNRLYCLSRAPFPLKNLCSLLLHFSPQCRACDKLEMSGERFAELV